MLIVHTWEGPYMMLHAIHAYTEYAFVTAYLSSIHFNEVWDQMDIFVVK